MSSGGARRPCKPCACSASRRFTTTSATACIGRRSTAVASLRTVGHALEFLKDQYRHAKPMLALGAGAELLQAAGIEAKLPSGEADPGIVIGKEGEGAKKSGAFVKAIAGHRHHERETEPPLV